MTTTQHSSTVPGRFGSFGGRYVSELLIPALQELERAYEKFRAEPEFVRELESELADWAGRPTPLTEAKRFSELAGVRVLLKREDLLHGGAHKTNNVLGQALLARALGKNRLIAETGAGQHGVATAMVGARLGMETIVYMGANDIARQQVNVERMRLCGAEVRPVEGGSATLKDAINEALRDWVASVSTTHYLRGSECGPHQFPTIVRDLQSVIGREARRQCVEIAGRLPDAAIACVGGGSNAIGLFHPFLNDPVSLVGVEPGGEGLNSNRHGATIQAGSPGLLHGARTLLLQDSEGQITASHSVSAGLDYPGVGPEHAGLAEIGRAQYVTATDDEALAAFECLSKTEGILPAFESAHALAVALTARQRGIVDSDDSIVLVNVSGRGDKDLASYAKLQSKEPSR